MPRLSYAGGRPLELEPRPGSELQCCLAPAGTAAGDLLAAARAALAAPCEFPRLRSAAVPGDRVAIALERGTPAAEAIVAALVEELGAAGIEPESITIVTSPAVDSPAATDDVSASTDDAEVLTDVAEVDQAQGPALDPRLIYVTHQPDHREELAYLAATEAGDPIYLHRGLVDADLVVSVGLVHEPLAGRPMPEPAGLFPLFGDAAAQRRHREATRPGKSARRSPSLTGEAREAAWLLGSQFAVVVVPGGGESARAILAGEREAVARRGCELSRAAWQPEVAGEPSLVLATIDAPSEATTWGDVARALAAAASVVRSGGELALACGLAAAPGPALSRLADCDDRPRLLSRLWREDLPDLALTAEIVAILEQHRVYLLADLDEATVESLGFAWVETAAELQRLARHHDEVLVLADAHRAAPRQRAATTERA